MPGSSHLSLSCPPPGAVHVSSHLNKAVALQFQPPFSPKDTSLPHGYNPSNYCINDVVPQNHGLSVESPYINLQLPEKVLKAEEFLEMLDEKDSMNVDNISKAVANISVELNQLDSDCFKYNSFIFEVFSKIPNKENFPINYFLSKIPKAFFTKIENFIEIKNIFEKAGGLKSVSNGKRSAIFCAFKDAFEQDTSKKGEELRLFKNNYAKYFGLF